MVSKTVATDQNRFSTVTVLLMTLLTLTTGCTSHVMKRNHSSELRKPISSEIEFKTEKVGDTYALVSWSTRLPTSGQVQVTDLDTQKSIFTTLQKVKQLKHSVRIDDLKPEARYRIQVVSFNDQGRSELGPVNTISTSPSN